MVKKRKIKFKKPMRILLKVIGIIFGIILIIFTIYKILENNLNKIGYSDKAAYNIITKFKISYVNDYPNNKTLNAAFETDKYYKEKNLEHYSKITYQKQDDLIKNINSLLKVGYSDREISMILKHGDSKSVADFAKKEKIKYLEEFFSYDFAKLENYDRYIAFMNEVGDDEETTIIKVNLDLDKEPYTDAVKVNDYSKLVLANKHHYLGKNYIPKNLINVPSKYLVSDEKVKGTNEAVSAAIKMIKQAEKEGLNLLISSGYRSYKDQEEVYNTYKDLYGESYCLKYVSFPGYSEHQTGYSFDFASGSSNIFKDSKEYKWMVRNSYKYGFIYRYLKSKEEITEITSEQWHFRYVGVDAAKIIDDEELSLEEYYVKYLDK